MATSVKTVPNEVFNQDGSTSGLVSITVKVMTLYFGMLSCIKTNAQKKLQWSLNAESAFISTGFTNWKKASEGFSSHGASMCHKEAVMLIITLPATTLNIATCLSNEHQREQLENQQCFLKIQSNIQFLARQGLPLRGHGSEMDSNFIQLL